MSRYLFISVRELNNVDKLKVRVSCGIHTARSRMKQCEHTPATIYWHVIQSGRWRPQSWENSSAPERFCNDGSLRDTVSVVLKRVKYCCDDKISSKSMSSTLRSPLSESILGLLPHVKCITSRELMVLREWWSHQFTRRLMLFASVEVLNPHVPLGYWNEQHSYI